jgi:ribosome-associated toxin RatA of RatAB toxin-antitoxin module
LLDVEAFADFMADVEWIKVIEGGVDRRKAEWSVFLRGSILRWSEEALIDQARHVIDFHQLDGDLSLFRGQWELTRIGPQCTRASLRVEFEIGIPLMAQMLNPVAKMSLESNTAHMFEALERRSRSASTADTTS